MGIHLANIRGNGKNLSLFNNRAMLLSIDKQCLFNFHFWQLDEWLAIQLGYLFLGPDRILSVCNSFKSHVHILPAWGIFRVCFQLAVGVLCEDHPLKLIGEPENAEAAVSEYR